MSRDTLEGEGDEGVIMEDHYYLAEAFGLDLRNLLTLARAKS